MTTSIIKYMKKCRKCLRNLDESNFGKHSETKDGLRSSCRECRSKNENTEYRRKNWKSMKNNLSSLRTKNPLWVDKTKKERDKRYRENNSEKIKARRIANSLFKEKKTCSVQGCYKLGEKHHENYQEPDKIEWLCRKHHEERHLVYKYEN